MGLHSDCVSPVQRCVQSRRGGGRCSGAGGAHLLRDCLSWGACPEVYTCFIFDSLLSEGFQESRELSRNVV